jgi:hypothetical protein
MPHHKWSQKQWLGMLFYLPVSAQLVVSMPPAAQAAKMEKKVSN